MKKRCDTSIGYLLIAMSLLISPASAQPSQPPMGTQGAREPAVKTAPAAKSDVHRRLPSQPPVGNPMGKGKRDLDKARRSLGIK